MSDSLSLSESEFPSLAIILVNWNSFNVTADCLKSLRLVDYPNFITIVVDNGSEDGSGEKLKESYPEIKLVENKENLGFTGGNNAGIQLALKAQVKYIMLLNNDTIVTPNFVPPLIAKMESNKQIGAVQPKIMFNKERQIIWNAGSTYQKFWAISKTLGLNKLDVGQFNTMKEVPWITGCCFLTTSKIVKEVGLLDQRFFIYYEDTDWSFKIRNLGYKLIFNPEATIYHEVGMSNENRKNHSEGTISPFSHYMTVRNHIYIIKRYSKGLNLIGAWTNQLFKFIGYVVYFTIRGRFSKLKFVLRGFRDGILKS
jgi:GT2 family glycosyltransferase